MRKLIWGVVGLVLVWSGYWFAGTWAVQSAVTQGLKQANAQGVTASGGVETAGFPTAFDITLRDLDLGNPVTGLRWQTPVVQLQAATWRPWHVVALLADDHTITLPDQQLLVRVDDARASLTLAADTDLTLMQIAATLTQPALQSSLGWRGAADIVEIHLNLLPDQPNAYGLRFDAANLVPDPGFTAVSGLAGAISVIRLDGTLALTAPLDRHAGKTHPMLDSFDLAEGRIVWGDIVLTAKGRLMADANGQAEGRIDIYVTGWRGVIDALVAAGTITEQAAPTIAGLLGAMAAQGGDPGVLPLPLVFANGRGTLGPLPLGPAPRLN